MRSGLPSVETGRAHRIGTTDGVVHISAPSPLPPDAVSPTPISPANPSRSFQATHIRKHEQAWEKAAAATIASPSRRVEPEAQTLLVKPSSTAPAATAAPSPRGESGLSEETVRWLTVGFLATFVLLLLATAQSRHAIVTPHATAPVPPQCLSRFTGTHDGIVAMEEYWMTPGRLEQLQHALAGKWLHLAGDSTMRFIYYDLVHLLSGSKQFGIPVTDQKILDQRLATRHNDQETKLPQGTRISFHWAPFVANISLDLQHLLTPSGVDEFGSPLPETADQAPLRTPDIIFNGCGLWSLLYQEETTSEREQNLQHEARSLASILLAHNWALQPAEWTRSLNPGTEGKEAYKREWTGNGKGFVDWKQKSPTLLFLSSPALLDFKLAKHRAAHALFRSEHVKEMNQQVKENFVGNLPMLHADTHALTSLRTPEPNDDGVHSVWAASRVVLNMASFMECMFE